MTSAREGGCHLTRKIPTSVLFPVTDVGIIMMLVSKSYRWFSSLSAIAVSMAGKNFSFHLLPSHI